MVIWFATGNAHKKKELAAILNTHSSLHTQGEEYNVRIPADAGLDFDPDETESTFHGNALLKAQALYTLLVKDAPGDTPCTRPALFTPGDVIIADDSGICVDALDGRPGIYSARYTGMPQSPIPDPRSPQLSSSKRNMLLLEEMGDTPLRGARFVCAMALLYSPERFFLAQETCEGAIVTNMELARGTGGFGYDPIFYIPEMGHTMAELSEAEKNRISHRGKAGKIIAALLNVKIKS